MTRYEVSDNPNQRFTLPVRGVNIILDVYFNDYSNAWFADFTKENSTSFGAGEKLVSGVDLGFKSGVEGIYIARGDGTFKDPDKEGWADLFFYVLDEDELDDFNSTLIAENI